MKYINRTDSPTIILSGQSACETIKEFLPQIFFIYDLSNLLKNNINPVELEEEIETAYKERGSPERCIFICRHAETLLKDCETIDQFNTIWTMMDKRYDFKHTVFVLIFENNMEGVDDNNKKEGPYLSYIQKVTENCRYKNLQNNEALDFNQDAFFSRATIYYVQQKPADKTCDLIIDERKINHEERYTFSRVFFVIAIIIILIFLYMRKNKKN